MTRALSRSLPLALIVVAMAVAVMGQLLDGVPQTAKAQALNDRRLSVNGTGVVNLTPDIAYVDVGADTRSESLPEALAEANTKVNAVVDALKKAGIAPADIQTAQYDVRREDPYYDKPPVYRAVNMVRVTIRTISKVGETLDVAFKAGANSFRGVQFDVADLKTSETVARKAAFEDAKARAAELVSLMGGTLGQVITIQDYTNFARLTDASVSFHADAGISSVSGAQISLGTLQISVTLTVTFEVK